MFAATEEQFLILGGSGELDRGKARPFVGAVAKRLFR
jgi:hypothetical protein